MSNQSSHYDDIKKLGEMIEGIKIAMITTADEDGTLRSRPMATQDSEFDGTLWFFTHASAPKVDEVQHEQHVNVSYAAPDNNRYVSVSGTAQVVRDRIKIEQLWKPYLKAWFPDGLDDPDIALLKVTVQRAEYWDSPSSTVVHLVGFAKAVATGTTYQPGENEKIELEK